MKVEIYPENENEINKILNKLPNQYRATHVVNDILKKVFIKTEKGETKYEAIELKIKF